MCSVTTIDWGTRDSAKSKGCPPYVLIISDSIVA